MYNGNKISEVSKHTHPGITLSSNLTWRAHIFCVYQKASKSLNMLKGIRYKVLQGYRNCINRILDLLWSMQMCFGTAVLMGKTNPLNPWFQYEPPGKSSQML